MELKEDSGPLSSIDEEEQEWLRNQAMIIKGYLLKARNFEQDARDYLTLLDLEQDELLFIWDQFESYERAALKRRNH